jgi:hypothetical protein
VSSNTIVVVIAWNTLLLAVLAATIHWRQRLLQWITESDDQRRNAWEQSDDDRWGAFLAEHPELIDR